MKYFLKPTALKGLEKLPKLIQKRILEKLDDYTASDNPLKFAKSLKYKEFGDYRYRIGDYRIIFDVFKNEIAVILIGHRRDIYH